MQLARGQTSASSRMATTSVSPAGPISGIHASTGEHLLLLNSDTVVNLRRRSTIFLASCKVTRRVSVVGPRLVDEGGRAELSFGSMIGPFNELRQKVRCRRTRQSSGAHLRSGRTDGTAAGLSGLGQRRMSAWFGARMPRLSASSTSDIHARRGRRLLRSDPVSWWTNQIRSEVTIVHRRGRSVATARHQTEMAYRQSQIAFYEKHHPRWVPVLRFYQRLSGAET